MPRDDTAAAAFRASLPVPQRMSPWRSVPTSLPDQRTECVGTTSLKAPVTGRSTSRQPTRPLPFWEHQARACWAQASSIPPGRRGHTLCCRAVGQEAGAVRMPGVRRIFPGRLFSVARGWTGALEGGRRRVAQPVFSPSWCTWASMRWRLTPP